MAKSNKGSSFERDICKKLSLWWSNNTDDDIFWRTSGSGARAKTRSKKSLSTFGQAGDVQATNPIGQPLIDLCSIELKRGYSKHTIADILDAPNDAKEQMYESFINQAITDSQNAKAKTWLLIVKRDRREALIFIPYDFHYNLTQIGIEKGESNAYAFISFTGKNKQHYRIFVCHLNEFLSVVPPEHILKLHEKLKR